MGRRRPRPQLPQSAERGCQLPREGAFEEPSAADQAYTHAVEVCDRIVRELDEQLDGWTPNHTEVQAHGTK